MSRPRDWMRAWSLRSNVRALFHCPQTHLRPVDGLRAFSLLGILACHTVFFWDFLLPAPVYKAMLARPVPRLLLFGELGVDLFFVISGFLISNILYRDHDAHQRLHLKNFYIRRFMRLLPAYFLTLALFCLVIRYNCHMAWTNIIYINNFVPLQQQCLASGWSLAIEEQFYSLFPLVLLLLFWRKAGHLRVFAGLFVLAVLLRGAVIWTQGLQAPLLFSMKNPDFIRYFDVLYDKPTTRYASLLCGVVACYLRRYTAFLTLLQRHSRTTSAVFVLALSSCVLLVLVPRHHTSAALLPPLASSLYLLFHRIIFALACSFLLLCTFLPRGPGAWLARFLSMRLWYPIAQLSYSAYLLHPIIIDRLYHLLPKQAYSTPALLLLFGLNLALSLFAAAGMYLLIERPIMNLRPAPPTSHPIAR